jgi:hypothetical protein
VERSFQVGAICILFALYGLFFFGLTEGTERALFDRRQQRQYEQQHSRACSTPQETR